MIGDKRDVLYVMDYSVIPVSFDNLINQIQFTSLNQNLYFDVSSRNTAQKMKFSIKNLFSKCDQIRRKLRIWLHLLKESLMKTSFFVQWNVGIR